MNIAELTIKSREWAEEEAKSNLILNDEIALEGIPKDKTNEVKKALVKYAGNGAAGTISILKLHGYLNVD